MRRSYGTAHMMIVVLEIIGWIMVALAVLVFFKLGFGRRGGDLAVLAFPLLIFVAGIAQVAGAQITRAVVATAEDSERTVELLARIERRLAGDEGAARHREPLAARSSNAASGRSVRREPLASMQPVGSAIKRYKGRAILRADGGVKVEGEDQLFANVIAAERFIDGRPE